VLVDKSFQFETVFSIENKDLMSTVKIRTQVATGSLSDNRVFVLSILIFYRSMCVYFTNLFKKENMFSNLILDLSSSTKSK
jgi:hypothetical protein